MNRKVIFMDIDGTLMEHGKVSQRVIDVIQRARAQGHLFFVCTGRSLGHMPRQLLEAEYLDGYVMGCGMHCVMGETVIHRERVDNAASLAVARYFIENGRECLYECENNMLAINSERPGFDIFSDVEALAVVLDDAGVSKITAVGPYREDDAEFFSEWFDVYDMGTYSDVVKRGVTKATGMQHVLDYLGIPRENCIGVGDSANDLPMLEFAGLGVAMGNAPENVKLRADVVTESIEADGVAVMIEKFVIPAVD